MSLLDKIKKDQLESRKERDAVRSSLLTTLYSEAAKVGKDSGNRESTDAEVMAVIKKFQKNNEMSQGVITDNEALSVLQLEANYLSSYMPKALTEEEVKRIILESRQSGKSELKQIMAEFKEKYAGQYDGGTVSKLAREA